MTISIWILFGTLLFIMFVFMIWNGMSVDSVKSEINELRKEYNKVTSILGTNIPPKPTKYQRGDIVVINTKSQPLKDKNFILHIRNVYCIDKIWLYSGIQIEMVKAPRSMGVYKVPAYVTTVSGVREGDIIGLPDISMNVFTWSDK